MQLGLRVVRAQEKRKDRRAVVSKTRSMTRSFFS